MKLRTDVLLRHDGKHVLCTGRGEICGPDEVSGDPTMLHDAMAARALLQAWDEMVREHAARDFGGMVGVSVLAELERRATALMGDWWKEVE